MGVAAAIGGIAGGLLGRKATSAQPVSQEQSQQSSTQVSQSDSQPWVGAQPGLQTLYNAAQGAFNTGGPQYYPGQTLATPSWDTLHGQNLMEQRGLQGSQQFGGASVLDTAQGQNNFTQQGGWLWQDPTRPALADDSNFDANTMRGMSSLGLLGAGGGLGRTAGMPELGAIGRGALLNSNPWLDATFEQAASRAGDAFSKYTMPSTQSLFSGAGRYGSNQQQEMMRMQQGQFGDQLNRLATDIYGGNYGMERNLLQQALNTQVGAGGQERNQQLQALGLQTGNQLQGQDLQLRNLGLLSSQFQNERDRMMMAQQLAPGLAEADYTDINALLGAGAMREQLQQAQIDDNRARFDYGQQQPFNNVNWLASIMSGAPMQSSSSSSGTSYGSSSGTRQMPGNPMAPLQGALFGSALGSGLGGMFPVSQGGYGYGPYGPGTTANRIGMY